MLNALDLEDALLKTAGTTAPGSEGKSIPTVSEKRSELIVLFPVVTNYVCRKSDQPEGHVFYTIRTGMCRSASGHSR